MNSRRSTNKGHHLEETLRAYFLRAGFFVVRNVPFVFDREDVTDVDLWLYERPTGTTRRVQIVDIKGKSKPKALERLFWTSSLAKVLGVDGAYVATTDKRPLVRDLAKKLGLIVIDGTDIQRIKASDAVEFPERLTDDDLNTLLAAVDRSRDQKGFRAARAEVLRSLSNGFGRESLALSMASFGRLAKWCVSAHPESDAAIASCRLAYLAAAIACESIDYISIEAPFRSHDERRDLLLNAVRYGALDDSGGQHKLRLAIDLIRNYSSSGTAARVEAGLKSDFDAIPAEIIADQAVRMLRNGLLFSAGRGLEAAAYERTCPSFDHLPSGAKSMLGAFLDFAGVRRDAFAAAVPEAVQVEDESDANDRGTSDSPGEEQGVLFEKGKA